MNVLQVFNRLAAQHLLFAIFIVFAGFTATYAQDGSTAYNYLNTTSSAHIFGLGGINVSTVADDLAVTDQNPALLGPEMDNQITLDYMHYVGNSNFAGVRYARGINERGAWSVGVRYFGYGTIKGADVAGNLTGTFAPSDLNFHAAGSYDITDRIRGGIDLKFLYSNYEKYSALAIATDLGVNYFDEENDFSASLVVANLGGQVKRFNDKHDRLPIDVRVGISKMFRGFPVRFSVTAWNLTKWNLPYWEAGDGSKPGETMKKHDSFGTNLLRHLVFGFDVVPDDRFFVCLGYNYKTRTDMSTYNRNFLSGFSIAAGMNLRRFGLSVGFAQPHSSATCLMLNLNLNINDFL